MQHQKLGDATRAFTRWKVVLMEDEVSEQQAQKIVSGFNYLVTMDGYHHFAHCKNGRQIRVECS